MVTYTLSTGPRDGNSSIFPFGLPNSVAYGEVFTAPVTGTLTSFTMSTVFSPFNGYPNSGGGVGDLLGAVGTWNGPATLGPGYGSPNTLYLSGFTPSPGAGAYTFSPDVHVIAGQQYVAFLTVYGDPFATGSAAMPGNSNAVPGIDYFVYNTTSNPFGNTSWDYAAFHGLTVADFSLTFTAQPPVPVPVPDFAHAIFGQQLVVTPTGVLANDIPGAAGDTLTVSAVDGVSANVGQVVAGAYGTLTLNADGSYTYTASGPSALPASGVSEDFFGYTALEGGPNGGGSASSTLTVVVTAAGLTYVAAPAGGSATQPNGGHYAVLDGTAGNATLNAANGVGAALVGGNGDTLNGATSGKDTFVFMGDFGTNTVNNYIGKPNGNFDVIQLSKADFGTNQAAIANDAKQAPGSANTVITDPVNHDTITLTGVSLSSLHFDANHFALV
jgi:VCBS repeat-containing protein